MSSDGEGSTHGSGCGAARPAALGPGSGRSWAGRAALVALALAAWPAPARPTTPTPTETATPAAIRGRVYDATQPSQGIVGAQVQYLRGDGRDTDVTGADGEFTLILELPEDVYLAVWVAADGYQPTLVVYPVADVRQAGAIDIGLQPAAVRVDTAVGGIVYDASIGTSAVIADAEIDYVSHSADGAFPDTSGTVRTGADGRYHLALPLAADDYLEFTVSAAGFASWHSYVSATEVQTASGVDFGLAPLGGVIQVEPPSMNVTCSGSFDVTITNVGPPGDDLVILQIDFVFDYGEGVYGMGFFWDLSSIQFPVRLASGERIAFPLSFSAGGEFPSRLFVTVVSGARAGDGSATYFGDNVGCHPCPGDCDGNGVVTIDELVRGVGLALLSDSPDSCPALDVDHSFTVSIDELVAAIASALEGCPPPPE
jgi:hypothetical protein